MAMKTGSLALSFVLAAAFNLEAQRPARPGAEGRREKAGNTLGWVAQSTVFNQPQCSPWIIDHGVLGTARHCFTHAGLDEALANRVPLRVLFSRDGDLGTGKKPDIILEKSDIRKVIFDSGDNDIAYILYDRKKTQGRIDIEHFIAALPPPADTPVNLAGFPAQDNPRAWDRLVSTACRTTGRSGRLATYQGVLEDTTCRGWFGVSGGVVYGERTEGGKIPVYGVVTHTFDVLPNGDVDPFFVKRDSFGEGSTTNFSPFSTAKDLQKVLQMR